jgi:hypothetical protein
VAGGTVPKNGHHTIEHLVEVYGDLCHWCQEPVELYPRYFGMPYNPRMATKEHLKPYINGGCGCLKNMRVAHQKCNNDRGHRHWDGTEYCTYHEVRCPRGYPGMKGIIWWQMGFAQFQYDFYTEG